MFATPISWRRCSQFDTNKFGMCQKSKDLHLLDLESRTGDSSELFMKCRSDQMSPHKTFIIGSNHCCHFLKKHLLRGEICLASDFSAIYSAQDLDFPFHEIFAKQSIYINFAYGLVCIYKVLRWVRLAERNI